MNNPVIWVAFYPSDWLAGTRGLTMMETGVYITLVSMMYETQKPLDMETKRLARLCGSPAGTFQKAIESLISQGKILHTSRGLWNDRVETELDRVIERSSKAKASAEARWKGGGVKKETTTLQSGVHENKGYQGEKYNKNKGDTMRSQYERNASQNQNQNKAKASASATALQQCEGFTEMDILYDDLLQAIGLNLGRIPTYWLHPAATIHISRWISDLGLTKEEIIDAARESRKQHNQPPNGPKGLDRVMQSVADAKRYGTRSPFTPSNNTSAVTVPRDTKPGAVIPSEAFADILPPADPKYVSTENNLGLDAQQKNAETANDDDWRMQKPNV